MQRVLLIEDDAALETRLRLQFESAGVALDFASDGYSAIDAIRGVFLATPVSEQTVLVAAPELLPRLFRKPFDDRVLVQTVLEFIARQPAPQPPLEPAVLIVDDDTETALMMKSIVEAAGWAARIASDGCSAIAAILGGSVDAMILDLLMPGIDGFSVLDYLRQYQPALLARTIVVSGLPAPVRDLHATPDVCAIFEKPLRPGALLDALARCLHPSQNEEGR